MNTEIKKKEKDNVYSFRYPTELVQAMKRREPEFNNMFRHVEATQNMRERYATSYEEMEILDSQSGDLMSSQGNLPPGSWKLDYTDYTPKGK